VPTSITLLLDAVNRGEDGSVDRLFAALHQEMESLARGRLRRQSRITFLDTTALVNECYLRLSKVGALRLEDKAQFLGYAARVMRSVVVDFVRRRRSERRGGGLERRTLQPDETASVEARREDDVLRVHDALVELAAIDPRLVQVVEMRYFAGLKEEEVAHALGVSVRTVARDWEKARLFLLASLG
jgi:RNA polymerase sigma factor (TIGR02999 family)